MTLGGRKGREGGGRELPSIDCDIVNLNAKEAGMAPARPRARCHMSPPPLLCWLASFVLLARSIFFSYGAIFEVIITTLGCFILMFGHSCPQNPFKLTYIDNFFFLTQLGNKITNPDPSPLCSNVCHISSLRRRRHCSPS